MNSLDPNEETKKTIKPVFLAPTPQPEEGLRAALKELRCIGKINGEVMEYTVHLPDNHVDAILQLFQSTMLSCSPDTEKMPAIIMGGQDYSQYAIAKTAYRYGIETFTANILKACGGARNET